MLSKIISTILLGVYIATSIPTLEALDETRTYRSILKIRTYEYNSTNGTYTATHIGSAVAIGSGRLLTNAHVIFDKDGEKPNGYYEICRTIDFRKKPVCFTSGELLAYDESIDLAVLSYREPSDLPSLPLFQESLINI
jgi:S1-C subfamily serine protease